METLVEIAKRLGIKPNPKMDNSYYESHCLRPILRELEKVYGKNRPGRMGGWTTLSDLYVACKYLAKERTWDKKKAAQQVSFLKTTAKPGIKIHDQDNLPVKLGSDGSFVYHSADHGALTKERFQIDLKMDSPNMEQMWQKLDDFIIKHRASYKVVDLDGKKRHERSDSLNLYMSKEITPEIAKELYGIIGPFLNPQYDEFLAGFPVKINGKNIKGFKYGPEPVNVGNKNRPLYADYVKKIAQRDLPPFLVTRVESQHLQDELSLGELSSALQITDLLYYLVGKEGKSPFQLGNQFGDPRKHKYNKIIDIANAGRSSIKVPLTQQPTRTQTSSPAQQTATTDKLTTQHFIDGKGTKGIRYLDSSGKIVATETFHPNCTKRVYANGLTLQIWENPKSITFTDGTKKGKGSTEIFVMEKGRYTKVTETTGALRQKINEVRKLGLFMENLPIKTTAIKGRLGRHSVSNSATQMRRTGGKVSAA